MNDFIRKDIKKSFICSFFLCLWLPILFSQSRSDVIAAIPELNGHIDEYQKAMPDWSEYFSIDDDFDITDLAKIRWVDYGEGDIGWYKGYESLTFNFNVTPIYRWYKCAEFSLGVASIGEALNYSKHSYFLTGEIEPGYYIQNFSTVDNLYGGLPLIYSDIQNGKHKKNAVFVNHYTRFDGKPIDYNDLTGIYAPDASYYENNSTKPYDKVYLSIVPSDEYAGFAIISDINYNLQKEAGTHLLTYNEETYELRSDGTLGSIYKDGRFYGTDDFIIKVLSYNDSTKLLLLITPEYTRPYIPIEDYFVAGGDHIYRRYLDVTLYEEPLLSSKQISTIKEFDTYLVIDDSMPMEELNGHISKWVYVKAEKTGIEGWVWGDRLETYEGSPPDTYIDIRFSQYNTTKLINKPATFNDTRVRCRTQPNLNCDTQGFYNLGDKVTVLYKSLDSTEIDSESWYWYLVRSDSLPDGWVYGKYLDIEE